MLIAFEFFVEALVLLPCSQHRALYLLASWLSGLTHSALTTSTQMLRLILFAKDVAETLLREHQTLLRFGAATGPVTVSYIATHRFA